jgi:hypothetical protein
MVQHQGVAVRVAEEGHLADARVQRVGHELDAKVRGLVFMRRQLDGSAALLARALADERGAFVSGQRGFFQFPGQPGVELR